MPTAYASIVATLQPPQSLKVVKAATASDTVLVSYSRVTGYWSLHKDIMSLHKDIMVRIHSGHLGIQACLCRAGGNVYWPRMNEEVRDYISMCAICCAHRPGQGQEPMLPHSVLDRPWSKFAVDPFQLQNQDYLITVHYYSGFYEVNRVQSTCGSPIIQALKSQFGHHGISEIFVSDNGPQFDCEELKRLQLHGNFSM